MMGRRRPTARAGSAMDSAKASPRSGLTSMRDSWPRRSARRSGKRYLLHDRDPLFTDEFRGVLAADRRRC
jgi:hypothetical protein